MAAEKIALELPPVRQRVGVFSALGWIVLCSEAVHGRSSLDDQGLCLVLPESTSDAELGSALIQTLDASRFLTLSQAEAFFDLATATPRYEAWVKDICAKVGAKSRRALFLSMKSVGAERRDGVVKLHPTWQKRRESWVGLEKELVVELQEAAGLEAHGAALRLALSRCIG